MIYLIIFFFFLILAIRYDYRNNGKNRELFYKIECLTLILLWGLRFRVGGDSLTYEEEFLYYPSLAELIKGGFDGLPFQPLWYVLNGIIKSIIPSFVFFQIIHAIFVNTVVFSTINKFCRAKFTAALFYYVFISASFNTEILREAICVAIFLLSFKYLNDNKWLRYYLLSIIAFYFHQSAIILFVFPLIKPFLSKSWTIWHYVVLSGLVVVIGIFVENAIDFIIGVDLLGNDFSNDKAIRYYATAVAKQETDTGFGGSQFGMRYLLGIFLSLYVIFSVKKTKLNTPENNLVVHCYLILTVLGFVVGTIAGRWNNYLVVLYYCIIADLLFDGVTSERTGMAKIRPIIIVALYTVLFVFTQTRDNSNGNMTHHNEFYRRYYPYHSVFNPQKDEYREKIRDYEMMP